MDHWKSVKTILEKFDDDKDAALDFEEFREMCIALFDREQIENSESVVRDIFYVFDTDDDHHLNEDELNRCYTDWISVILNPRNVLVVVDVQNDFIDGSLALRKCAAEDDGAEVVEPINKLIQDGNWKKVMYSRDWHPPNHIGFFENLHLRPLHADSKVKKEDAKVFDTVLFEVPYLEQQLWPVHCVADTWGAQLHKDLIIAKKSEQILKGQNPEMESYSAFFDNNSVNSTELLDKLKEIDATDIYVCGLAYDVCVKATCLDGLRLGYRLALIEDCCRGIDTTNMVESKKQIENDFGLVVTSEKALKLASGQTRSLVMARQAAAVLAKRYGEKN